MLNLGTTIQSAWKEETKEERLGLSLDIRG